MLKFVEKNHYLNFWLIRSLRYYIFYVFIKGVNYALPDIFKNGIGAAQMFDVVNSTIKKGRHIMVTDSRKLT